MNNSCESIDLCRRFKRAQGAVREAKKAIWMPGVKLSCQFNMRKGDSGAADELRTEISDDLRKVLTIKLPKHKEINDNAGILSPDDERVIMAKLDKACKDEPESALEVTLRAGERGMRCANDCTLESNVYDRALLNGVVVRDIKGAYDKSLPRVGLDTHTHTFVTTDGKRLHELSDYEIIRLWLNDTSVPLSVKHKALYNAFFSEGGGEAVESLGVIISNESYQKALSRFFHGDYVLLLNRNCRLYTYQIDRNNPEIELKQIGSVPAGLHGNFMLFRVRGN